MTLARALSTGLVLLTLTTPACTTDDAVAIRARAEEAVARVAALEAQIATTRATLSQTEAELTVANAAAGRLEEELSAARAALHENDLLLEARRRELAVAQEELATARADAADLSAVLWELRASATLVCPLPSAGLPYQDLPPAVAETRARIHAAAVNCDWLELHRLADEAGGIAYADGAVGWHGDPVPYWLASPGELQLLAGILEVPFGTYQTTDDAGHDITVYIWPAVTLDEHQSEADWVELRRVYSEEEIERIRTVEGYLGFAVTIEGDGSWRAALHVSV